MLSNESEKKLERFEAEWDSGAVVRFDQWVADLAGSERDELLSELIMIDAEKRFGRGTAPSIIDAWLRDRFRQYPPLAANPLLCGKIRHHLLHLHRERQDRQSLSEADAQRLGSEEKTLLDHSSLASQSFQLPYDFGDFTLLKLLDQGGMGMVYEARQRSLPRTVAVKVIRADIRFDAEAIERFDRETKLIAAIHDPHVVPILESGCTDHYHYYTMPFYRGGTLGDRIHHNSLTIVEATRVMLRISRTVAAVHELGIVHRDLKPRNILFADDGTPHVADFGLSRHTDQSRSLTRTGQIHGTPGYIAPERIDSDNKEVDDLLADQYSLGAILYALLCGRPPFRGVTAWETLIQARSGPPLPPIRLNQGLDRDLNTICMKALATRPEDRYASCSELADDLENYLSGRPIRARPPSLFERGTRLARRHPAKAGLIASTVGLAIIACFATVLWFRLNWQQRELDIQDQLRRNEIYSANVAKAAQRMADRSMGWRRESLDILTANARLDVPDRDLAQVRSMIATAAVHHDVSRIATLAHDVWCDAITFDPAGQFLAIGQNQDTDGFRVLIYRTDDLAADPYILWIDCEAENDKRRAAGDSKVEDGARAICFSPNSDRLAIGTRHGRVHIYGWTGERADWIETHDPDPGVEVKQLGYPVGADALWTLSTGKQLHVIRHSTAQRSPYVLDSRVDFLVASPTENAVYLQMMESGAVVRLDGMAAEPTWQVTQLYDASFLSISPDGKYLATASDRYQTLTIFDTERGSKRTSLSGESIGDLDVFDYHLFGLGGDWLVSSSTERTVAVWDLPQRRVIASLIVAERGGRALITASPSQPLFAVAEHLKVAVYRVEGTDVLDTVCHSPGKIGNVAVDVDGAKLATVTIRENPSSLHDRDVTHAIWNAEYDQPWMQYRSYVKTAFAYLPELPLAFAVDGDHLFSADGRGRPRIIPRGVLMENEIPAAQAFGQYWIPESEIERLAANSWSRTNATPQVLDRGDVLESGSASESSVGDPVIGAGQSFRLRLPKLPGSAFEAIESIGLQTDVYLVFKSPSQPLSTRVHINSGTDQCYTYRSDVNLPDHGSFALFVGTHTLRTPRVALEIELEFEPPVPGLLLEGVSVRANAPQRRLRQSPEEKPTVTDYVLHPGTHRIWAVVDDEQLMAVDLADWSVQSRWKNLSVSAISGRGTLSPLLATDQWIVSGTTFGEVFVFDSESSELMYSGLPLANRVQSLCQLGDDPFLAAGGSDGMIHILELPTLNETQLLAPSELSIDAMCYDSRRQRLIAGGEDGKLYVFNRRGSRCELDFTIQLGLGRIQCLRYLPQRDALAVLIRKETAIRLIHLDRLEGHLEGLNLVAP